MPQKTVNGRWYTAWDSLLVAAAGLVGSAGALYLVLYPSWRLIERVWRS